MKIVIFCGGYGTRMWPVSRKTYPKQFYPLIKGRSFFQMTVSRFKKAFKPKDIFVSTEEVYISFVRKQAPEIPKENIIAEPERKDNLGAVGLSCAIIERRFPGEVMMVSWSDHFISQEMAFLQAVSAAGEYADKSGLIVSVDEKPTYPSVHHGWVKTGKVLSRLDGHNVVSVLQHVEKPAKEIAERLFSSGDWMINTGYRAWRADVMLSYYKKFVPKMYAGLIKISEAWGTGRWEKIVKSEYHKFEKESVEYGIFEKLPKNKRATIPVEVGWEDAGTWELFYKALITPKEKTIIEGGADTEIIDADRNLIVGQKGKVIAVIGLSDIVVADTPDGLLVCKMDKTDKVKDIFKKLEAEKKKYVE